MAGSQVTRLIAEIISVRSVILAVQTVTLEQDLRSCKTCCRSCCSARRSAFSAALSLLIGKDGQVGGRLKLRTPIPDLSGDAVTGAQPDFDGFGRILTDLAGSCRILQESDAFSWSWGQPD